MSSLTRRIAVIPLLLTLAVASCASSAPDTSNADSDEVVETTEDSSASGIRLVSAEDGATIQTSPPQDLVILDVRTLEEFSEGHLEGAAMLDFYRDDFADELAKLDRDVPYLLYCRSGNRSGQTAAIMRELGFTDVADIDGGIGAWNQAGLPTVTE